MSEPLPFRETDAVTDGAASVYVRSTIYQRTPIAETSADEATDGIPRECCLVQIYPVDVMDGMWRLRGGRCVIGRDPQTDLMLSDASVSRRHAEIQPTDHGHRLVDLNSTNGTHVNGVSIREAQLRSGDTVRMGTFIFKYLAENTVESRYHETVYTAMTRDMLTGTFNKRYYLETLEREQARASRQRMPLSLLMIDIDHFKAVNNTYGHLVGDEVLREFGRRLRTVCRHDDLVGRYGGEEFSFVMANTPLQEAIEVAERCRRVIECPAFETAAGALNITASIGVAETHQGGHSTSEALIAAADAALYGAKARGRNQVVTSERKAGPEAS